MARRVPWLSMHGLRMCGINGRSELHERVFDAAPADSPGNWLDDPTKQRREASAEADVLDFHHHTAISFGAARKILARHKYPLS